MPPLAQGSTHRSGEKGTSLTSSATPGMASGLLPPFRYDQGAWSIESGQPIGVLSLPVTLAVDENEIHAPALGIPQGRVTDGIRFAPYDTGSSQPRLAPCCRQCMDMVGVGAAEREQMVFTVLSGMLQVVFELAPLVAGDGRMDQVIPLAPQLDVITDQQRMV